MISRVNGDMQVILGSILKNMREEAGYTIKEFSEMANIERNGYSMIEKGKRNVSIGILCKISSTLNITPTDIINSTNFTKYINKTKSVQVDDELTEDMLSKIDMKKLGNFIKKKRERLNLSQQKFADSIEISRNEINRIENNRAKASQEIIEAICTAMKMTKKELFNKFT